jgi:hypothetical protein
MKNKSSHYLIELREYRGDTEKKYVNKEIYDWITSNDMGQAPEDIGLSSWVDQTTPESLLAILKEEGIEKEEVDLTRGSWQNDRALWAMHLPDEVSNGKPVAIYEGSLY